MSSPTVALLTGLAEYLTSRGVGLYKPSGKYTPTDTAIVFYQVPQAPDRVITLTPYAIDDALNTPVTVQGIQARVRGPANTDARWCEDTTWDLFNLLHGAEHLVLGGVRVDSIERRSSLLMGADGSGRWEISSSFALTLDRPTVWRTQ